MRPGSGPGLARGVIVSNEWSEQWRQLFQSKEYEGYVIIKSSWP